jgi:uncharacterized protein YecE (DUF72 family)
MPAAPFKYIALNATIDEAYGGYSSVAEHRSVAPGVVGSIPTSRPNRRNRLRGVPQSGSVAAHSKHVKNAGGVYIGCSGWAYSSWKPEFYPASLSSKKFLEYYATRLNSVEVNYTFRSLPTKSTIDNWLAATGETFRFSFKAPQRITHLSRLKNSGDALNAFVQSIAPVREANRLGAILFQLPPNMKADTDRLGSFLQDAVSTGLRLAFEFRHESWFDEATYSLLREHSAALCVAESDDLRTPDVQTAPFSCYRLRKSEYSDDDLEAIRRNLRMRSNEGDVYAYFKHEEDPTGALYAAGVLEGLETA